MRQSRALPRGLIFGLAYEKPGSLFAAMAAHLAGNLGGLIPVLMSGLDFSIQIIISAVMGIISITLCILMAKGKFCKSKEDTIKNGK